MSIFTIILATIVALEHFYIFYLESVATQSDTTSRVFNVDKEELARSSVSSLFKNQEFDNFTTKFLFKIISCFLK